MSFLPRLVPFARFTPRPEHRPTGPRRPSGGLRLRWLGTAGHVVASERTTILLDPFLSRPSLLHTASRKLRPRPARWQHWLPAEVDAIVLGHSHYDHLMDAPSIAKMTGTNFIYDEGSDQITLTWKSFPGDQYGIQWSGDLDGFAPAVGLDPVIEAHPADLVTTYGPFANPAPGAERVFLRIGPPDLYEPTLDRVWGNNSTISLDFSEAMHATPAERHGRSSVGGLPAGRPHGTLRMPRPAVRRVACLRAHWPSCYASRSGDAAG